MHFSINNLLLSPSPVGAGGMAYSEVQCVHCIANDDPVTWNSLVIHDGRKL